MQERNMNESANRTYKELIAELLQETEDSVDLRFVYAYLARRKFRQANNAMSEKTDV